MTFGPAAVSNKKRPPFGERLRSRWFRSTTGQPFIEEDVSSSQTQVLAYLLGDKDLEQIASTQSFNGYLAQRAWRDYERGSLKFKALIIPGDKYTGPDDSRLRALVKETWMRTLYGSQPYSIVKDQRNNQDEVGQGWDISNLKLFLETVPGWKTVNTFLNACQAIGMRDDIKYGGVTFHDPFDRAKVRWHPAARTEKSVTANSTSGGFMFYIDAPTYPMEGGEFHVDDLKMRNCVAPRLVHMLDAALNALVIERLATVAKPGLTFAAIHDAWVLAPWGDAAVDLTKAPVEFIDELAGDDYIPIWPDEDEEDGRPIWVDVAGEVMSDDLVVRGKLLLRRALDEAAKDWFESLDPVYDDLIRYLDDTEFSAFAHKIKARWERRLADCRAGRAKWPQFRLG